MMEFFRNWLYWLKQGQSLRAALDTAKRTLPDPTKPRRKRGFFLPRFPSFWSKP